MTSELTSTLLAAGRGDSTATSTLETWKSQNYGNLAVALAQELLAAPPEARSVAALFLKNMLAAKHIQFLRENIGKWKAMDVSQRKQVKDLLLQALTVSQDRTAHFAALAASEIAAVELPYNEWPELVSTLMERVTTASTPDFIKQVSLECLGYTAERVADLEETPGWEQPTLQPELVDRMLTTIVDGCQPSKPELMRLAALTALKNSLMFVRKNMDNKPERDFIFQAMCEATRSSHPDVCQTAFSCMDMSAVYYYDKLQDYMAVIFQLTTDAIKDANKPEGVKMAAMEFWNSLCEQEQQLLDEERDYQELNQTLDHRNPCPKYVLSAMETLVPLLLEKLTHQDEEIEDDMATSLNQVAAACLETMSATVENDIVRCVVPFVEANINSDNWRMRGAAIVAFTCILDGPTTEVIGPYVNSALPILLQALVYPQPVVQDSATHCVSNICKYHILVIPNDQVHIILHALLQKLQAPTATLASHAATAIYNIALASKGHVDRTTNVLSVPMFPCLSALVAMMDREDAAEANLRTAATSAIAELISCGAADAMPIFQDFLPVILDRMEAALKLPVLSSEDVDNKESLLGQLCGIAQMLFQKLQHANVNVVMADRAMNLLLQVLQVRNATCHEEAFLVIGAIAGAMEDEFVKYLQAFVPLLVQGLRSSQALGLCQVSVGVVVDICTAVGGQIQPFCDAIMEALRSTLSDSNITRDIKPTVIALFGDIAMAIGAAFEPYLQVSIMMLMQASQQCMTPTDDEDLLMFFNSLRLAILEAYSGIVFGLVDGKVLRLFVPNLVAVLQFLQYLSSPESNKDERVLAKALALTGDIAKEMLTQHPQGKSILSQPWVAQLIQEGCASPDDEARSCAEYSRGVIHGILQQQ